MDKPQGQHSNTEYKFPKILATSPILANLIPVFGVVFWGWSFSYIVLLYWLEILITVLFTLRMIEVRGVPPEKWGGDEFGPWLMAILIYAFFGLMMYSFNSEVLKLDFITPEFFIALGALVVNCGVSVSVNFRRDPEKAANVLDSLGDRALVLFWLIPSGIFCWLGLVTILAVCAGLLGIVFGIDYNPDSGPLLPKVYAVVFVIIKVKIETE